MDQTFLSLVLAFVCGISTELIGINKFIREDSHEDISVNKRKRNQPYHSPTESSWITQGRPASQGEGLHQEPNLPVP